MSWDWFNNYDYYKSRILDDPSCLFKVVEYDNVLLIDLIIKNKTIRENELLYIGSKVELDWFKISQYLPLSIDVLIKYRDKVDWQFISTGYLYKIDKIFIDNFENNLNFSFMHFWNLDKEIIEELVFIKKCISLKEALNNNILLDEHIIKHIKLFSILDLIRYKVSLFEELNIDLINYKEDYTKACIDQKFLTNNNINIITNWIDIIKSCKPSEEYIIKNIINKANKIVWDTILINCNISDDFIKQNYKYLDKNILVSQNKFTFNFSNNEILDIDPINISKFQKLSSGFIDILYEKYPSKIDWYYLCEYQDLPEWFIRKYHDKVDWYQISKYQNLSIEFILEFKYKYKILK